MISFIIVIFTIVISLIITFLCLFEYGFYQYLFVGFNHQ